jgi:hypothetical protein
MHVVKVTPAHGDTAASFLPRLGWGLCGPPAVVDTTSPAKAATVWFSGAVVRPLGHVITMRCPWCSQAMTATCLAQLQRRSGGGQIEVILDHAPSYQGPLGEAAWARYQIRAHRLPPDSPEMNAADSWSRWANEDLSANT